MNVERLHAVLEAVRDEIDQQGMVNDLTAVPVHRFRSPLPAGFLVLDGCPT